MTGALAAIDVQNLARDKTRGLQVQNRFDNVRYLTHATHRVQPGECAVSFRRMHWGLDHARRLTVYADTPLGVFDGQRLGRGVQATFRQRSQHRRNAVDRVIDQAGGDVDDMPTALLFHLRDGQLRDMEETVEVHRQVADIVFVGERGKWLGDEDAGVVDHGIDTAEAGHRFGEDTLGNGA